MSNRFYLHVEIPAGGEAEPAIRTVLAECVYLSAYSLTPEGDKLALEVWTCAQPAQAPLIAAAHDLVRRFAADQVTSVYIEDDRGSTEQYLGPWQAVQARLAQDLASRQAALQAAYQRQMHTLAHAESRAAFVITEGW